MASRAGKCTHAAWSITTQEGDWLGWRKEGAVREFPLQGGCWCQDSSRRMVLANLEPPRQRAQQSQRPWWEVPDVSNQEADTAEAEGPWRRRRVGPQGGEWGWGPVQGQSYELGAMLGLHRPLQPLLFLPSSPFTWAVTALWCTTPFHMAHFSLFQLG